MKNLDTKSRIFGEAKFYSEFQKSPYENKNKDFVPKYKEIDNKT